MVYAEAARILRQDRSTRWASPLSLLPVEEPLVRSHLDKIAKTVDRGISGMNWNSSGINEFID